MNWIFDLMGPFTDIMWINQVVIIELTEVIGL